MSSTGPVDRCPYGDFLRDSRRVVGPSSSSPVYHIINGPRQKKKTVSQNNTQIDKTREPYKEYVSSSIITICTTCFVQLKRELKLNNPNRQVIQTYLNYKLQWISFNLLLLTYLIFEILKNIYNTIECLPHEIEYDIFLKWQVIKKSIHHISSFDI